MPGETKDAIGEIQGQTKEAVAYQLGVRIFEIEKNMPDRAALIAEHPRSYILDLYAECLLASGGNRVVY